jgi:hypothetical protein
MTKTKQAVRSIERPGQPRANQSGMPYGTGSLQMRGTKWWIVFRDAEGRGIQENTRTEDFNAALRMLAERALETARARVAALEKIVDETEGAGTPARGSQSDGDGAKRGPRRRIVPKDSKVRQKRTRTEGGR